jgi:hypothetical protein
MATDAHAYTGLLSAAKLNPQAADFTKLRVAYAKLFPYVPSKEMEKTERIVLARQAVKQALELGDLRRALKATNHLLGLDYLDVDSHVVAACIYNRLGDETKAAYHRRFGEGILDSILQSGDGQSQDTAFTVTNVREEYAVLRALGIRPVAQRMSGQEGYLGDVFEIQAAPGADTYLVYFRIGLSEEDV